MPLEFRSPVKLETPSASAKELQWIANLDVAYGRVQQVVNDAFKSVDPSITINAAPALVVVPDDDFAVFISEAAQNQTPTDAIAIARQKELANPTGSGASALYLPDQEVIVMPQRTATVFQKGGMARIQATMTLMEEYLHFVTTKKKLDDPAFVARIGFTQTNNVLVDMGIERGVIYKANMVAPDKEVELSEAGGDVQTILTENATTMLVNLLAANLGEAFLNDYSYMLLSSKADDNSIKQAIISYPNALLRKQLIRALLEGNSKLLDMSVQGIGGQTIKLLEWFKINGLKIFLNKDAKNLTGIPEVDSFSYEDATVYTGSDDNDSGNRSKNRKRR